MNDIDCNNIVRGLVLFFLALVVIIIIKLNFR